LFGHGLGFKLEGLYLRLFLAGRYSLDATRDNTMKELAIEIMAVCRGHYLAEVQEALNFVQKWVQSEAFVPTCGIQNPVYDLVTGRVVEREMPEGEDLETLKHELATEKARADVLQELLNMNPLEVFIKSPADSSACQSAQSPD
jgi:hypothetical protein